LAPMGSLRDTQNSYQQLRRNMHNFATYCDIDPLRPTLDL